MVRSALFSSAFDSPNGSASTSGDDINSKLCSEWELLKSAAANTDRGIDTKVKDMIHHPGQVAELLIDGAVAGLTLAQLKHNPETLFGAGGKIASLATRAGLAAMAVDLGLRVKGPVTDVWSQPTHLESAKIKLGEQLGAAVVEYTTAGLAGLAGYKYLYHAKMPPFITDFQIEPARRVTVGLESPALPANSLTHETLRNSRFPDSLGRRQDIARFPVPNGSGAGVQIDAVGRRSSKSTFGFDDLWKPKRADLDPYGAEPGSEVHDPWMPANNLDPYGNKKKT